MWISKFLLLVALSTTLVNSKQLDIPSQNTTKTKPPSLAQKVAFLAYTAKYGKNYQSTSEFNTRFQNWLATDAFITAFKDPSVVLQHNKFSDWTEEERNGVLNSKLALAENADLTILGNSQSGSQVLGFNSNAFTATTCPDGQFLSGSTCKACPSGCKTCVSATFCTACLTTNFFWNSTTKLCTCTKGPLNSAKTDCTTCGAGTFFNATANVCTSCIANCTTCTNTTSCSLCANNYQFIGGKCICNGPIDSKGWCSPCASNEYYSSGVCKTCAGNCTTCSTSGSCTACSPSFTLSAGKCTCKSGETLVDGKCTTAISCTTGFYNQNNTCTPCSTFCASCVSKDRCLQCQNNGLKIVNSTDAVPCYNCDPTFLNTPIGQCRCDPNKLLVGAYCFNLTDCKATATYNKGDGTCLPCQEGCAQCGSFSGYCYKTTDPSLLINTTTGNIYCPADSFYSNIKCVPLIKCPIGQYNDGSNNCIDCEKNCDICTNITGICHQCKSTFTLSKENTCGCLSSQYLDIGTDTNSGNCIDLKNCGSTFFNPGYNNCTSCVQNCDVCSDVDGQCSKCLPTFTLGSDLKCACNPDPKIEWYNAATNQCIKITNCSAGFYNDGQNNCLACPANCAHCDFGTGICTSCNATFTANGQDNTCSCQSGQFMTALKNGVCQSCPALCPTCQDLTGNCLTCVNNLAVKTSVSPNPCACTPGFYLQTSSNMCTPCATNCTACNDGTGACSSCVQTYTLQQGACSCLSTQAFVNNSCATMTACQSGYYNQGNNVCTIGPERCTTVANWTGLCQTCNATFTYDASSNTCNCSSNKFQNAQGVCQSCPANCTACDSTGACTQCASTFTLQESRCACNTSQTNEAFVNGQCTSLTPCPPGKFNTGINTCATCPLAKCGTCSTYTGICTACASTFTATLDGASQITQCSCISGQYLNSAGQCQACPQNCTTCADGTGKCTSCSVGFTMDVPSAGKCACNPNTQAIVNGQCVALTTCPSGQYATNINTCASCPAYCTTCSQIYGICSVCQNNLVVTQQNTCACVNNTYAFDGYQCQRCNVWVGNCNTCSSPGTCSSCLNGYTVSGNSCVCNQNTGNTGGTQYLDSAGKCNNCPTNCTTCFSTGNGLAMTAGECTGCVSSFTGYNLGYRVYWPPSGYQLGWYQDGTSNQWHASTNDWRTSRQTARSWSNYWTVDFGNVPWGYYYYPWWGWTAWQWDGNFWYAVFCTYWPSQSDCHWAYYLYSWRSYTCSCQTGSQTLQNGYCAAIISCPAMQYNDGTNTCKPCGKQCSACNYQTGECTRCYTGATYNSGSNVCSCPTGQYGLASNSSCTACPANCVACAENTGICTTCQNNLVMNQTTGLCSCSTTNMLALVGGYCVPMTTPAIGYYNPGNNTAILCPTSNCYTCSAYSGVCNKCNTTFILSGSSCICPAGTYKTSGGTCMNCPANCTACNDFTGVCNACVQSFTLNLPSTGYCGCAASVPALVNNRCTEFLTCPAGQYNPGNNVCYSCGTNCATCDAYTGKCNACVSTFTYTAATDTCACKASQYLSANGQCTSCPTNCTACSDTTGVCTQCSSSFSLNSPTTGKCGCMLNVQALVNGACVALSSCPTGQYNPGNNVCTNCATDCASCVAYTGTCSQCKPTFINGTTANTCVCPAAQFKNSSGSCQQCATNCTACSSSSSCTTCATTFTNSNGVCGCASNQYMSSKTGTCLSCPQNCTSCNYGSGTCITCADSFDLQPGGSCSCNPLTQALVQGVCVALAPCPVGQYNPGNNVCTACTSNCYSCAPYTGKCTQCQPTFTYNSDANRCTCTNSQYKITSTQPNTCANCGPNCLTCADTTGSCTSCMQTFSRDTPTAGKCGCNPTTEALVNNGTACAPLTNCATPGRYNPGNNTCVSCLTPNCKTCSNYTGICSVCSDTFTLSSNNTCECTANQFQNSSNKCQVCPQNCTTCSNPTGACTLCQSTFTLNSPSTGKCGCSGKTPVLSGSECVAMTVCDASQFNPGNNNCTKCPTNAVSCADITGKVTECQATFTLNTTTNTCSCTSTQYLKQDGTCGDCPANCSSCAASTGLCTKCSSATMVLSSSGTCGCLSTQTLVNGSCAAIKTCPSGQYNPGTNICQPCKSGCSACSYWTGDCTACKPTFNFNPNNATCECLTYQFLNQTNSTTQTCINCPTNCTTCVAPKGVCNSCVTSFTLASGKCSCATGKDIIKGVCTDMRTCDSGTYNDGQNNCLPCSSNCLKCSNSSVCLTCSPTFTLTTAKSCACPSGQAVADGVCKTATICPTGQYNDGTNKCIPCPSNCTTCNNTGFCSKCKPSFLTNTPTTGKCGCNSSMAFDGTACVKPTTCKTGQYNPGNNTCINCPANCSACTQLTGACTSCRSSFVLTKGICSCNSTQALANGICTTLYNCTAGNFNPGNNTCLPCTANCFNCSAFTGVCQKCNLGYLLINNVCVAARMLQDSSPCSKNCLQCDQTNGICLQCSQNTVRSELNPSICEECQYLVGPIGKASVCLTTPFAPDRLVPQFNEQSESIDWRKWSVVGSVKDQGKCGGDFAFSTTAAAETAYAIKTGQLYDLSEQYLLDCDVESFGCSGGFPSSSSKLLATQGAVLEKDYPFVGAQTGCRSNQVEKVFQLQYPGSQPISQSKEAFKSALRKGPLNVSFRVTHDAFFYYSGGILSNKLCPAGSLNHAMLAVGYGKENSVEYALIQNQWGEGWGEQGLIRVELTDDSEGACGLYLLTSLPTA